MSDARFARLKTDPRFRRPKKAKAKVVYGRKVSKTKDSDNLKRFYRLQEDEDDDDEGAGDGAKRPDFARGEGLLDSSSESDGDEDEDKDDDDDDAVVTLGQSSSRPIPVEDAEIDLDENTLAELDAQAAAYVPPPQQSTSGGEATSRIAVVNLDWDHVRAVHLLKIFSSVDKIRRVRVYPSEFGRERMAREEREGPPPEVFGRKRKDEDEDEENVNEKTIFEVDNGQEYDQDALRKYQLERLRYYYAVVECDSVQAAEHIYNELEGTELERSANVLDLSYVPEDMPFNEDFRDEATEERADFKAVDFTTDALRHSRVKLTWDEDDPERAKLTRRALTRKDLDKIDFKAYIASASEDSGDEDGAERERKRALLLRSDGEDDELPEGWGGGKPDKAGEMEITFVPGLSNAAKDDGEKDETTLETYRRRQKEKKAARKAARKDKKGADEDDGEENDDFFAASEAESSGDEKPAKASKEELAQIVADGAADGDGLQHFDMRTVLLASKAEAKKGRTARKMKKKLAAHAEEAGEGFVLDVGDARFAAVHDDPAFAIDPSNPKFKRTKGMEMLLEERARRQQTRNMDEQKGGEGLDSLVESVKRKAKAAEKDRDARASKKRRTLIIAGRSTHDPAMFKYINILLLLCAMLATLATALPTERSPVMLSHMRRNDWDAAAVVPREVKVHARARYERPATANGAPSAAARLRPRAQMGTRTWKKRLESLSDYEPLERHHDPRG
ncbi:hypothetical protein AURDEDRAFT_178878 [Auricularia subglabra TFB-10046 SS5]|nr:hypothetical protein AURDEDRAFT_178878 [Auricularia subglabra TFB-10046 SS5]